VAVAVRARWQVVTSRTRPARVLQIELIELGHTLYNRTRITKKYGGGMYHKQ